MYIYIYIYIYIYMRACVCVCIFMHLVLCAKRAIQTCFPMIPQNIAP